MKKFLVFLSLWFLVCFASVYSQQSHIDSLRNALQYEEVIQFIEELQTQDENLLFQKAQALQEIGNLSEAIYCLQKVADRSQNVKIFRELANYQNRVGDKKQALATLQKALEIEKSNSLYYEIAKLQYRLRYFKQGSETCDKVLSQDTLANIVHLQSSFYKALGQEDKAEELLKRAIAHNPKDYIAVKKLASFYKAAKDYESILPITEAYLLLDAMNVEILSLNAYAYFSLRKYPKAKKVYEKLFELGYAPAENYFYLGYACYRLGHSNDAYNNLYKANELAQGLNEYILNYLGLAAIKSLRYEEAVEFLDKALQYYLPDNEMIQKIYTSKAEAYRHLGQDMMAIKSLRKGMKYHYKHRTLFRIAHIYDVSDKPELAIKAYKKFLKALAKSPENDQLKSLKFQTELRLQYLLDDSFMRRDTASTR